MLNLKEGETDMKEQIAKLQRQNNELKESLFDCVLTMKRFKNEFGMGDQETYSKASSIVMGTPHNPLDFLPGDNNGEQGR